MRYDIDDLPLKILVSPVCEATAALARLDERISVSSLGGGLVERLHFADAVASLWVDGELVHLEDLVLHDAAMGVRAPSHELTIAHDVLRTRRRILSRPHDWALSEAGLRILRGGTDDDVRAPETKSVAKVPMDDDEDDALDAPMAEIDALLARSQALLSGTSPAKERALPSPVAETSPGLERWRALALRTADLPPVLRAALLMDSWQQLDVDRTAPWLGRLLGASLLREAGLTPSQIAPVNLGLKSVRHERRRSPDRTTRLLAILEGLRLGAEAGLKEHDRLALARQQMERQLVGRRSTSRLPELIDLVLSRPMVSATMISEALGVTPQGALKMAADLRLRELTGRGRFRAWGIL